MPPIQYRLLFIHLTEHVSSCRVESGPRPHSARPRGYPNTPPSLLPSGPRASEGSGKTKVLHTGGWAWTLWVTEHQPLQQRHVIQILIPSLPPPTPPPALLTLLVVSANTEVDHFESAGEFLYTARMQCAHSFSPLTARGPQTLVKK